MLVGGRRRRLRVNRSRRNNKRTRFRYHPLGDALASSGNELRRLESGLSRRFPQQNQERPRRTRRTRGSYLPLPQNQKNPFPNGLSLPSRRPDPKNLFPRSHLVAKIEPRRPFPPPRNQLRGTVVSPLSTIIMIAHDLRNPHLTQPHPQSDPPSRTSLSRLLRNQGRLFYLREPPGTHQPILFVPERPPRLHPQTLCPRRLPLLPWRNAVQVYPLQL